MPRTLTLLVVAAAAAFALASPAPALAAKTECAGKIRGHYGAAQDIRAGGRVVARLWMHSVRPNYRGCVVLRAVAWKGTPHYMFVRVCDRQVGPRKLAGCTGHDAGQYREFAGPIYFPRWHCYVAHVKLQPPGGGRMIERFLNGPCN